MVRIAEVAEVFQGLARSGRAAGARPGDWRVMLVESGDIKDDGLLDITGLPEIMLTQNVRTKRHVLRPFDVLVTARTGNVFLSLVPACISRTVAGVTLLVIRPRRPDLGTGMGHFLWYFLSSSFGRRQLIQRLTLNATTTSLPAKALADIEVPLPTSSQLKQMASLVEASEEAYTAAMRVATLRRTLVRDSAVIEMLSKQHCRRD